MKRTIDTKFFTYSQNNSGGKFHLDKTRGLASKVIVEAVDCHDANARAEKIGLYFGGGGDCPCCGDRWCDTYDDSNGTEEPMIYNSPLEEYYNKSRYGLTNSVAVHYMDGKMEVFGDNWDD